MLVFIHAIRLHAEKLHKLLCVMWDKCVHAHVSVESSMWVKSSENIDAMWPVAQYKGFACDATISL